jgi:large subunit ribosomal protein L4
MASLTVHDQSGKKVGTYKVEPTDFAPHINKQLLHDAVVMYQANLRQGSAATKSRADVSGSTKKMYRQKGTGNARAGSRRSGIRRGGGHIFAKRSRDFSYSLPRKALQLATRMAIAAKIRDDQIVLVDELAFDVPKTSQMVGTLAALGCDVKTVMLATDEYNQNVYKSARNIRGVSVVPAAELNALTVLGADRLVLTKTAMDALKKRAASGGKASQKEA